MLYSMSGHSHFATIKRQKGLKDAAKGNIFGKLSKNISIAIKSGGGTNPDMNFKLRIAIDKAKEFNMPKDNIDRILKNAEGKMESLEEIRYEGFGPYGIAILVDVVTDNKNRSAQEFKNIFEKAGGNIAGPGAVSYNFDNKGYLLLKMEGSEDELEDLVDPQELNNEKKKAEESGFTVLLAELRMIPKTYVEIEDPEKQEKIIKFLETLEDHDDVQKVYSNF